MNSDFVGFFIAVENLEWTDGKGNTNHAVKNGHLKKEGRPVIQMDLNGDFLKEYQSIKEASIESGVGTATIKRQLVGKVKNPRKYKWKYKDEIRKEEMPEGKKINGYSKYIIVRDGKVYSSEKKIFLKPIIPKKGGYPYYSLYDDEGNHKNKVVHRLLAEHYLENENELPCVNHKDGNKLNYNLENLEWVTFQENSQHAIDEGLNKNTKKIIRLDLKTGEELGKYYSIAFAQRELNLTISQRKHISDVCKGKRRSCAGYDWKYL